MVLVALTLLHALLIGSGALTAHVLEATSGALLPYLLSFALLNGHSSDLDW